MAEYFPDNPHTSFFLEKLCTTVLKNAQSLFCVTLNCKSAEGSIGARTANDSHAMSHTEASTHKRYLYFIIYTDIWF